MAAENRDTLGRLVRAVWIAWAKTQPNPKPSWLVPFDELSEPDKEVDRQIGDTVAAAVLHPINDRRIELAKKASRDDLVGDEAIEFRLLQDHYFAALAVQFGGPKPSPDLEAAERRLANEIRRSDTADGPFDAAFDAIYD